MLLNYNNMNECINFLSVTQTVKLETRFKISEAYI